MMGIIIVGQGIGAETRELMVGYRWGLASRSGLG
jgi:hypothetical protein